MIIDGRYYTGLTGSTSEGNSKYSPDLKECIERAGEFCLSQIKNEKYDPGMLLGSIQSGKTRGFIGLMALCFDNDFDMAIILTKCSKALVEQTVKRLTKEFAGLKRSKYASAGDIVAEDILKIDFTSAKTTEEQEAVVSAFLNRYKTKKRILVVKKQPDNVDRMNMLIKQIVGKKRYSRLLIIDDEADVTSIGYEKNKSAKKDEKELTLRRISGAINTARRRMHSKIEYAVMQVTATPYALYLQPEIFMSDDIMPIKPGKTIVMPTGKGYIGGKYYFMDSQDETSGSYYKAQFLPHIVGQNEMSIINGTDKNSGKNSRIGDRRTVRIEDFIVGQSQKNTFALPEFRRWIFDILVGSAILQLNEDFEDFYVSAVLHAATPKSTHKAEVKILREGINEIRKALAKNLEDEDVLFFINESYNDLKRSVLAYDTIELPSFEEVVNRIASMDDDELSGLISEIDLKEVNSDADIMKMLDDEGELLLENSITIFVGGQVLDRGITIPNMINFFYGRDPVTMQQDTVVQHCRMLGYRGPELLSVTRLYTTNRLFNNIRQITERDEILRKRVMNHEGSVVYLEAGGDIRPCGPAKILASDISSIMPEKRYLPVGFDLVKSKADNKKIHDRIEKAISSTGAFSVDEQYRKGESPDGKYTIINSDTALKLIKDAYCVMEPKDDGTCNTIKEMEPAFQFSISELLSEGKDKVALIVRRNRHLGKYKNNGMMYQDAPDDGNNEGALAKKLRSEMPVLVMTEQTNPEWKYEFWWPVYYTPEKMNVGIYAEAKSEVPVGENLWSAIPRPMMIKDFILKNEIGVEDEAFEYLSKNLEKSVDYYNEHFRIGNCPSNSDKRKEIICPVYLEDLNETATDEYVDIRLEKLRNDAMQIMSALKLQDDEQHTITDFFDSALQRLLTDEIEETVFAFVKSLRIRKPIKDKLLSLMEEVNNILYRRNEPFGYFVPVSPGRIEIHIYFGTMEYYLDENRDKLEISNKDFDKELLAMTAATIAHEIFHAIHYTDVMTESGRWLYTRKGFIKQKRVQESMAEYFSLCYSIDEIDKDGTKAEVITRSMRNIDNFPKDEYAGGLRLERDETIAGNHGNLNPKYIKVYSSSLNDMLKSDELLCK